MHRIFLILTLLTVAPTFIQAQSKMPPASPKTPPSPAPVFTYVEQMPEFPGNINSFIAENLIYPSDAVASKIEGKVLLCFVVSEMGIVKDVTVSRSAHPLLDKEAIRVISAMPTWRPGKQNGSPVSVYFTLPISFRLNDDQTGKK